MNPPQTLRIRLSPTSPTSLPRMPDRPRTELKSTPSPPLPSPPPPSLSLDTTLAKRARRSRKLNTSPAILTAAANLSTSLTPAQTAQSLIHALEAAQTFLLVKDPVAMLERQEALDDTGGLANAVDAVVKFRDVAGVQAAGFGFLGLLKFCAAAPLRVSGAEVVEVVVGAVRSHARSREVVMGGLRVLCGLCRLEEVRCGVLGRVGAIGIVVRCLRDWGSDRVVVEEAGRFLAAAAVRCEENKTEIGCNGGLDELGRAVRSAGGGGVLTAQWCAVVRNVTVRRLDVVRWLGDMGCVEELLGALGNHGGAEEMALHALAALYHVVVGEGRNARRLVRWEGWEVVLWRTATMHFERWRVLTLVFGVAGVVAEGREQAVAMVEAGMVQLVLDAMHRHVTRRGLLYYGARCVRSLLVATEQGMEQLRRSGGMDRLLDLLYCSVARPVSDTAEHCAGYTDVL